MGRCDLDMRKAEQEKAREEAKKVDWRVVHRSQEGEPARHVPHE